MVNEERLDHIQSLLTWRHLSKKDTADEEIVALLAETFDELAGLPDYESSRRLRAWLFDFSAAHYEGFFAYLFSLHRRRMQSLGSLSLVPTPGEVDCQVDYKTLGAFLTDSARTLLAERSWLRLSEDLTLPFEIPDGMANGLLSMVIDVVQYNCVELRWTPEDFRGTVLTLVVGRQLARVTGRLDLFYGLLGVVIEHLNISQEYQLCRDFAEEALLTSFSDGMPEWGYFLLFKAYNGQFNANAALVCANACISVVSFKRAIQDRLFKLLLFEFQRYYRNIRFKEESDAIYKFMIDLLPLDQFEEFDVTNTHLATLLTWGEASVVMALYEYLSSHREFIFRAGKSVALPLLNTVYNVRHQFEGHPDVELLEDYVPALEAVVGSVDSARLRALAYGGSSQLKELFVNQLLSLSETRGVEDFVSEVRAPLVTADRLITFAFDNQDKTCFLLAMILKADYTWVFPERGVTPLLVEMPPRRQRADDSLMATYEEYGEHIRQHLRIEGDDTCLWLAEAGREVYGLELRAGDFSEVFRAGAWNPIRMHEWLWGGFADLFFDETIKDGGQVRQYLEDDQLRDMEQVKSRLDFAKVNARPTAGLLLVKDMAVSGMPHNLILDREGEFISRRVPMTCIPSAEWYIKNSTNPAWLRRDFTTAMWIPTEGGDFALNLLWSRLEVLASSQGIEVTHAEVPARPLNSDVNILSAHGASDISAFPAFTTREGAAVINLDRVVAGGTILVLLVCHSGSMGEALLRNKIQTLVRKFLSGYQAVVAPFWSLHVSIPPVWLPAFLSSLRAGNTVSQAVFDANSSVFEMNKNPGAWACLHLYGNPYLKIAREHSG